MIRPIVRRLRPLDRLLLFTLTPLWVGLLAFDLYAAYDGTAGLAPAAGYRFSNTTGQYDRDHYPVVTESSSNGAILRGDLIVSASGRDLRGVTRIPLIARWQVNDQLQLPLVLDRSGERIEVAIPYESSRFWWRWKPALFLTAIFGTIILLRAPFWHNSRFIFVGASLAPFCFNSIPGAGWITYADFAITSAAVPLIGVLGLSTAFHLTEKRAARTNLGRWAKWLVGGGLALVGSVNLIRGFSVGMPAMGPVPRYALAGLSVLGIGAALWGLTSNYRRADPPGQRQIKWIVLGGYIALVPYALSIACTALLRLLGVEPLLEFVGPAFALGPPLAAMAIPICLFIAIFGYRFLDVDPLISAASSYSILGAAVLVGILMLIPQLAEAAATAMGVDVSTAQLGLSAVIAAAAIPLHRSIRPRIDRWFYPERNALARGIKQLLRDLRGTESVRELTTLAAERLHDLLRPESCVVYAAAGSVYEPVFVRGNAVPSSFAVPGALRPTHEGLSRPHLSGSFTRQAINAQLSQFDRAALDTLGAAVVVPIRRRGKLTEFLCLGAKRSGDVFTATDEALLSAVANAVSAQLERFDDEEVVRESRAMQEELRRYVPGAISRGMDDGEDLEPREHAVTILFVDIRGHTPYAEKHSAREVFTTINRYTQTVSSIVEKFGGNVVEFNGDGMMAVFGAPRPLPDREKAAVLAARAMFEEVAESGGSGEPISVGVGIATGAAFVGTVQAADRLIWTALGDTTNFAARLEGLTRDLDAAIVIDLATRRGAGEAADGFELREQVQIRGRRQQEDLYLLPLPETS